MRTFVNNFLRGCLVVVPVVATLYAVFVLVRWVDGLLGIPVPGAGFVITVLFIVVVGRLASSMVGKRLVELPDRVLGHTPFVKLLYTSLRDLMSAVVGERKTFDRPVRVSLDPSGAMQVVGFVTRENVSALGLHDHVAVYFPQSINFAGQLVLVQRERITPIDLPAADVVPLVVSGGMAG